MDGFEKKSANGLYEEILQIPARARECLEANRDLELPTGVPYIGMGSSYYAPQTLQYSGINIQPYMASEYYNYLAQGRLPLGVLISQSGESSETVWNLDNFKQVISITGNPDKPLGTAENVNQVVNLHSSGENYSSTMSYINTLISLWCGHGIDPAAAIDDLEARFGDIEELAKNDAQLIARYIESHHAKGLYVLGSGPNFGTAQEAALTLGETTKLSWIGMPVAQYDHGPKETANDSVVVILNAHGKDQSRIEALKSILGDKSNALVLELEETNQPEELSPLALITRLNLIMKYLADELGVGETFVLGGKQTTFEDPTNHTSAGDSLPQPDTVNANTRAEHDASSHNLVADIGGTNTRLAWANGHEISGENRRPSNEMTDFWPAVIGAINDFRSNHEMGGIKISVTGAISDKGVDLGMRVPVFDLKTELEKRFNVPVKIANDMTCLTLGELHEGAARGMQNGIVTTISTGVNAGIVQEGAVLPNPQLSDQEYGRPPIPHALIAPGFRSPADYAPPDLICYDNYISGGGLFQRARLRGLHITDVSELDRLAAEGNPGAIELYTEQGRLLAEWLSGLILNQGLKADSIVMQGSVGRHAFPYYNQAMEMRIAELLPKAPDLKIGELGDDAGMIGATYL